MPLAELSYVLVTRSYRDISSGLARRVKLIMTDIDGTLTLDGEHFEPVVAKTVAGLRSAGIIVGLVSGRTLPRVEKIATLLDTDGPLIAENGGVARLTRAGELVDLGYSRQPALEAIARLKKLFPGCVHELEDNKDRLVDVTIGCEGLAVEELKEYVPGIQLLDSGYMVHLLPDGISKGKTLMMLLDKTGEDSLMPEDVMVFGDSPTDVSLFESFPHSVLVLNPNLPPEQRQPLASTVAYSSDLPVERGFVQVAQHIIHARHHR